MEGENHSSCRKWYHYKIPRWLDEFRCSHHNKPDKQTKQTWRINLCLMAVWEQSYNRMTIGCHRWVVRFGTLHTALCPGTKGRKRDITVILT